MINKVAWYEGLLLAPQHFQHQQRYYEQELVGIRQQIHANYWGFFQLSVCPAMLALNKIKILSASGIFKNGFRFEMPGNLNVPEPLSLNKVANQERICLQLVDDHQSYQIQSESVIDEYAEYDKTIEVDTVSYESCLVAEKNLTNAEGSLPIVKKNIDSTIDDDYHPPFLNLYKSDKYQGLIIEIVQRIEQSIVFLQKNQQEHQLYKLNTLLSANTELTKVITQQFIHPEQLYYVLLKLVNELEFFSQTSKATLRTYQYCHEDLTHCFTVLFLELIDQFNNIHYEKFIKIDFVKQGVNLWQFSVKNINTQFILVINCEERVLSKNSIEQLPMMIKISSIEKIEDLIVRGLPGAKITKLQQLPEGFPETNPKDTSKKYSREYYTVELADCLDDDFLIDKDNQKQDFSMYISDDRISISLWQNNHGLKKEYE